MHLWGCLPTPPLIMSQQNQEFKQVKVTWTLLINKPELLNLLITFSNILASLKKKRKGIYKYGPLKYTLVTYKESMNAWGNDRTFGSASPKLPQFYMTYQSVRISYAPEKITTIQLNG